jgi:hypothetical protein
MGTVELAAQMYGNRGVEKQSREFRVDRPGQRSPESLDIKRILQRPRQVGDAQTFRGGFLVMLGHCGLSLVRSAGRPSA